MLTLDNRIYKDKYMDDPSERKARARGRGRSVSKKDTKEKEEKKPRDKSRSRGIFGRRKKHAEMPEPLAPATGS